MRKRIVYAWHALVGGRIGPVGWCGQKGYWWVKPCPCYKSELWGCGWFSGSHGRVISYDEAFVSLDIGDTDHHFLPVRGHSDDDECTYRSDGTDDTYCGLPKAAHEVDTGDTDKE